MRREVKVIARAKANSVTEEDGRIVVRITKVPVRGEANAAMIKLLARYLGVPQSTIRIARGAHSRHKVVEF